MTFKRTKNTEEFFQRLHNRKKSMVLVSEPVIATIYHEFIIQSGLTLYLLPEKEAAKTRKSKNDLEDFLLRNEYGKDTELVAFGGGCVLDVTGFVASTYMRGIGFSVIPTTVIAYVDASIGGKNGINTPFGKNQLGSFYPPLDVCREKAFLNSLSSKDYFLQYSEVFKIMLCFEKELAVYGGCFLDKAIALKKRVVKLDPFDNRDRKILNFGHTFAHALETSQKYQIGHGKAVWHGIYFACFLSFRLNLLSLIEWERIKREIDKFSVEIDFSSICPEEIFHLMKADKKSVKNNPSFILLEAIGRVHRKDNTVAHVVEQEIVIDVLSRLKEERVCIVT